MISIEETAEVVAIDAYNNSIIESKKAQLCVKYGITVDGRVMCFKNSDGEKRLLNAIVREIAENSGLLKGSD